MAALLAALPTRCRMPRFRKPKRLLRKVRDGLNALAQEQRRTTELEQTVAQYAKALRQPKERVHVPPAWMPLLGWCVTLLGGAGWAHTAMLGGFGVPPVVLVLVTAASFVGAEGSRYLRNRAAGLNKLRARESSSNRHGYDTAARNRSITRSIRRDGIRAWVSMPRGSVCQYADAAGPGTSGDRIQRGQGGPASMGTYGAGASQHRRETG